MEIRDDFIKITTFEQVKYHLRNGELILIKFTDGEGCFCRAKDKEDRYEIHLQPTIGISKEFINIKLEELEDVFESTKKDTDYFVCKGAFMSSTEYSVLDKITGFLSKMREGV